MMGFETSGFKELADDLAEIAAKFDDDRLVEGILTAAAEPIYRQMRSNAASDPRPISGKLLGAIKIRSRKGRYRVTIGVHKGGARYAAPVEYGHGGPHPAPPHPFIRPAFDQTREEANAIIQRRLLEALDSST